LHSFTLSIKKGLLSNNPFLIDNVKLADYYFIIRI